MSHRVFKTSVSPTLAHIPSRFCIRSLLSSPFASAALIDLSDFLLHIVQLPAMPRPPWLLFVLLDAIDALRLQRSYAFASRPGEGNPASVGVLGLADAWPEAPASGEATAFVRSAAAEDAYDVRYFAGGAEIAFCGHATLAAADAVLEAAGKVDLVTSSGKTVAATRSSDGAVELRLAAGVSAQAEPDAVAAATAALGGVEAVDARYFDDTTLVIELSPDDYASLDAVDAAALKDIRLVVAATTRASGDLAFRSRCFVGGAEDLACGVAHCGLAPYWAPKMARVALCALARTRRPALASTLPSTATRYCVAVACRPGHVPGETDAASNASPTRDRSAPQVTVDEDDENRVDQGRRPPGALRRRHGVGVRLVAHAIRRQVASAAVA